MCLICVQWESGKLSSKEAFRSIGDIILDDTNTEEERKHIFELSDRILDKDIGAGLHDQELDSAWHDETHGE